MMATAALVGATHIWKLELQMAQNMRNKGGELRHLIVFNLKKTLTFRKLLILKCQIKLKRNATSFKCSSKKI